VGSFMCLRLSSRCPFLSRQMLENTDDRIPDSARTAVVDVADH
jgi:hypothetical protein